MNLRKNLFQQEPAMPRSCDCPKAPGFLMSYVLVFFVFTIQWVKMVVTFVDFGEIVDHHFLNFLFIIVQMNDWGTIESELLRSKI